MVIPRKVQEAANICFSGSDAPVFGLLEAHTRMQEYGRHSDVREREEALPTAAISRAAPRCCAQRPKDILPGFVD